MSTWHQGHRPEINASRRRRHLENPEHLRLRDRVYYAAHAEQLKEDRRRYRHAAQARDPIGWAVKERERSLRKNYGMGMADWDVLFESQGRACAICKTSSPGPRGHWHTDHDHANGRVRGILCAGCNLSVGFHEGPTAAAVVAYLTIFPEAKK